MRERGHRKARIGVVTSNKGDKSVTVEITRRVKHPKYGKYVNQRKRFHAHDENNECGVGDKVRIVESRPLSKTKRWRVAETLYKAPQV
jgi:small subunit ribosomal protein S17